MKSVHRMTKRDIVLTCDVVRRLRSLSCQKLPQRILAAYILYSLYAPHPISINPFKSALFDTFTKERNTAVQLAGEGKASDNEQLVWVLWKVLKGDGDHVRANMYTLFYSSLSQLLCSLGLTHRVRWLESLCRPS
jgi:hypothetical protein